MAGDWIKMRGALIRSPKLIRVARELQANPGFREWLTPGGGSSINGQIVSNEALRCVTFALLGVTWSYAREHGKWIGDDILLPYITLDDLDGVAGVEGFGRALEVVNWVTESDQQNGVIFNNFKEFNVPMTPAEKQREYRQRKKNGNGESNEGVTEACNGKSSNVTTRVEKSREESKTPCSPPKRKRINKDCEIPKDFQPNDTCKRLAEEHGVSIERELPQFVDHWIAKGQKKRDWQAAFRTWIRNAPKFGGARKQNEPEDIWAGTK